MRDLTTTPWRPAARRRVLEQLAGIGVGVTGALLAASAVLAFGTSASAALEDVYEPASGGAVEGALSGR